MQPSDVLQDKNKLIGQINSFFDKEVIEKFSRESGFVKRRRMLEGMDFFFFACLRTNAMSRSVWKGCAVTFCKMERS